MNEKLNPKPQNSGEDKLALKAGILYLIAEMFTRGISFMVTPIFTRLLPPAVFADAKIFESWVYLIAPVISVSMYQSMARGKFDFGKNYGKFLSSILFFMSVLTAVVLVIGILFADFFADILGFSKPLLLLLLGYCLAYNGIQCVQLYDRQLLNYRRNIALTLLSVIPGVLISLILVILFRDTASDGMLLLLRIVGFFLPITLVGLVLIGSVFLKERAFINKEYWIYGIRYSAPLMAAAVSSQIFFQTGNIFVRNIVGADAAAIVAIAMTVGYIMDILIHAIDNAWKPWMFDQLNIGQEKRVKEFWRFLLLGVALLVWMLTVFAPELVLFLGGSQYTDSVSLIYPILCASLANFLMIGYTSLEQYFKQTKISGIASVLSAGANLLLNYVLITAYGYQAAAYTLFLAYAIACVIHFAFLRKVDEKNIMQSGYAMALIAVTVGICAATTLLYGLNFFARCGIFLGLMAALGLVFRKKIMEMLNIFLKKTNVSE